MDKETKIRAALILDVIGKPAEHIVESLGKLIEEVDNEKGVTVKSKSIKEPTLLKDSKEFYTTFAEVEIEVEDILYLAILLFKYMPAHLEIIEPEMLVLSNNGWNDILNELVRRLHGYDEIARVIQLENQGLKQKITELTGKQVITPLTPRSELSREQAEELAKASSKNKKKTQKKSDSKKSAKKK